MLFIGSVRGNLDTYHSNQTYLFLLGSFLLPLTSLTPVFSTIFGEAMYAKKYISDGEREGEKIWSKILERGSIFLPTFGCCLLDFEIYGEEHFRNKLYCFKNISHRLTPLVHIISPCYFHFIFPLISQIYDYSFYFSLIWRLRVFLFLRKRKMKELCEGMLFANFCLFWVTPTFF